MSTSPSDDAAEAFNQVWLDIEAHALEHTIPLATHIDLTYRCDLACIHCYLEERVKHELSYPELVRVFDDLQALGGMILLLSGGDIFLRPDALDILRAACERRFYVHIITHAGHITAPIADALADMGVAEVKVSIYSSRPEVHDAITRLPGSLHKSLRAIELLRQRGVRVEMKCPVFADNRGAHLEIPTLAAKYDCTYVLDHQIRAAQGQAAQGQHAGNLPPQGLHGACHDLRGLNMSTRDQAEVVRAKYPDAEGLDDLRTYDPTTRPCNAGRTALYIDPEGQVFPCLEWEEPCGDLRNASLTEIWTQAPVFQRARTLKRADYQGCSSCENFDFCIICPGQSHRESGRVEGVSPTTCRTSTATRVAFDAAIEPIHIDLADWMAEPSSSAQT